MENKIGYATNKPTAAVTVRVAARMLNEKIRHIRNERKINVSPGDVVIFFLAKALNDFKEFNSNFNGVLEQQREISIGYLINIGKGTQTLTIENTNKLKLIELSGLIKEKVMNYLRGEDLPKTMPTFTITNLSSFGSFNAIPPLYEHSSCTLAICSEIDGYFNLTLAFDSRVADCQRALSLLNNIKEEIEKTDISA